MSRAILPAFATMDPDLHAPLGFGRKTGGLERSSKHPEKIPYANEGSADLVYQHSISIHLTVQVPRSGTRSTLRMRKKVKALCVMTTKSTRVPSQPA